jgi:hypothetical protein
VWLAGQQIVDGGGQGVGIVEVVLIDSRSVGSASWPANASNQVPVRLF